MQAARHTECPTLIQGQIESLAPDGTITGWVRDTTRPQACHVQVRRGPELLAEAVADLFRPDLLRAGQGHGHYGFATRLRHTLPPGRCRVDMVLPASDVSAPMALDVPALDPGGPCPVERLLAARPAWSAQDVIARPDCIDAGANHASLGRDRFIDAVFRFALGRWPSAAESAMNASDLDSGRITPAGLLLECLGSRERAALPPGLPSPYAADFPFLPPEAAQPPRGSAP